MRISVIIPTRNEATTIAQVVADARAFGGEHVAEVIVVDGGSTDDTVAIARRAEATVLNSPQSGRAAQMNMGARHATGDILYFVHADVRLHPDFVVDIHNALVNGYSAGRYRFRFDADLPWLLRLNSYATRFGGAASRGGDQTLFMKRSLFKQLNGFDERYVIMEDFDMIRRIEAISAPFVIIPKNVIVSARKYQRNGWLRVQLANLLAVMLFSCHVQPIHIARTYKRLLR
ncbi:TIGR04283 family arsenosugar biosynthesis glycosyltransferase [Fibrella sp. HMF5335]|uniref:TIGR04283 family arsenosugar biosynthesis glycosyltransferase n=1 Tax=Fibrella rubiginis TaxID=2817060 RepID=A0A939GCZ3_9BACT|nr:TIGR04283 family arsenosugar biosynthesis glycosyltransferase [Fibrella rubiginis]MBO0936679.1 TIGR04283 family arsenosugar biosynthesis glycosyltransferase [Fibrella rubiginis]